MGADVPALKAMLYRVWHQTYTPFLGAARVDQLTSMWHQPELLSAEVDQTACATFVAVNSDDEVVGHALAAYEGEGRVHLKRLYLDQSYHGQGTGKVLLQEALAAFPNGTHASLEVYANNRRAVAFYHRNGFSVSEKLRDEFAEDELYEYRMVKSI